MLEQTMAREELKWQNIDADDLPTDVKQSFDAMIEAEAAFKAELEKLLKKEGKTSWCRVYEHTTRWRRIRFAEVQNQMSRHRCRLRKLGQSS